MANGELRYIYDGRNVIQERDSNNTPLVGYTRGWDLSASFQGAGGIGGMLARSHGYSAGSWSTHNAYHADGSGNITYLVTTAQGLAASYRYDPFGNTVTSSGTLASANRYRFSSKYAHTSYTDSGLYYYGYRWYEPNLQRWLNQDPIGENGGFNLYGFVGNNPLRYVDPYGHEWYDWEWIDTAANWGAGLGDGLSLNLTKIGRDVTGLDTIDPCSTAYSVGGWSSFAFGSGRLAYAGLAKAGSVLAKSGVQASRFRTGLRNVGRAGFGKEWRKPDLSKYPDDDALRAAAGRTNPYLNIYGAGVTGTSLANHIAGCDE